MLALRFVSGRMSMLTLEKHRKTVVQLFATSGVNDMASLKLSGSWRESLRFES